MNRSPGIDLVIDIISSVRPQDAPFFSPMLHAAIQREPDDDNIKIYDISLLHPDHHYPEFATIRTGRQQSKHTAHAAANSGSCSCQLCLFRTFSELPETAWPDCTMPQLLGCVGKATDHLTYLFK